MIKICNILLGLLCLSAIACSKSQDPDSTPLPTVSNAEKNKNVVLFLGDSLTAGYQLAKEQAYPALIAEQWRRDNFPFRVRNAGVSGYTSNNVLANLNWWLNQEVHTVFLAIGANDGLRGYSLTLLKQNLRQIINKCRNFGAQVVLAGMKLPPNYGAYAQKFAAVYPAISQEMNIRLMPFLLSDVAGNPQYNLSDGIHPNPGGHRLIARNVLQFFKSKEILP